MLALLFVSNPYFSYFGEKVFSPVHLSIVTNFTIMDLKKTLYGRELLFAEDKYYGKENLSP
jgi:hypothetical protein